MRVVADGETRNAELEHERAVVVGQLHLQKVAEQFEEIQVSWSLLFFHWQISVICIIIVLKLEIDRYGFFGADTDISAIHGPIADITEIFISCFLLHYQKYYVFYALPFFQKLQKSGFMS